VEPPPAPAPPAEPERAVAYNVPPPREVTGHPSNPRRGWWSRAQS
jgi:hypothetical protein